jgi:hypothetical protein
MVTFLLWEKKLSCESWSRQLLIHFCWLIANEQAAQNFERAPEPRKVGLLKWSSLETVVLVFVEKKICHLWLHSG